MGKQEQAVMGKMIELFEAAVEAIPETRQKGKNNKYTLMDATKSGLAVFYFQHPSLLNFQQEMKKRSKRCNLETLFGVKKVPCGEQIRNIVDDIDPKAIGVVFDKLLGYAQNNGVLETYSVLDEGVLIVLDGVWYFSSDKVSCDHCLRKTKSGKQGTSTTYYHSMIAAVIAKPGSNIVLPLMPEMIRNEDGHEKQDCERNAAKRWLDEHKEKIAHLKPTFLGDDLYASYPMCQKILDMGMNFIFTCKHESHEWIADQVEGAEMESCTYQERKGRNHLQYRHRWMNNIEIRADGENININYLYLEIYNEEKGEITYKNSWMTNKQIDKANVRHMAECARARWKIENENNNVLKNRGYNLEHDFGHGSNHASEIFCVFNLISFLMHSIQDSMDLEYQMARDSFGRRDAFFWSMRYEMSRYLHPDWSSLLTAIAGFETGP
jgi:hypothetical protein